jgi:cytosine deaminase
MLFDLLLRNVRIREDGPLIDIGIREGRIEAIGTNFVCDVIEDVDGEGAFAFGGFVDSHIHLDKACILDRCTICEGTLAEAVSETARAKEGFLQEDVYLRAVRVVEKAIIHGTTRMRAFVEVDPRVEMRSFRAIKRIKRDYAFAIDIEICVFAQEGLTNEPETLALLDEALADGADALGGCPYTDPEPRGHVTDIFDLAQRHDVPVDFHIDFDLDPENTNLPAVIEETWRRGYQGRVSLGHVTNLSAMAPEDVVAMAQRLAEAGIALAVLPATDLFLTGRGHDRLVPRGIAPAHVLAANGVATAIATNNILNPFTPYGDASLMRMANLYANVAQLSRPDDLDRIFQMVTGGAACLMGGDHGIKVGAPADIVLLDAKGPQSAVREIAPVLRGWKRGRKSFENGRPVILKP